ncbi:hypothetical protein AAX09_10315 (plasmid) [Moraxella bovoculi]|uniref:DsbC family protein n=1 Tax=Moraxella bovoculi TaxID=386891 RepID=UPI000624790E|nr:DsbC family protein [Moraxella bovoculi]AKG19872.1 hypothetical protein AAX09_10315 [Moraxella bovoculi]
MTKYCLFLAILVSTISQAGIWDTVQKENALVYKKGDGSRVFGMVTDIDCGYCRMLEREIQAMDNITVYKFMVPAQDNQSESISIWCSANRHDAFLARLMQQKKPRLASCANPIAKNIKWASSVGLYATPILFKPNGQMHYGYATKSELERFLR